MRNFDSTPACAQRLLQRLAEGVNETRFAGMRREM
jgi:hypothetical protein